MPVPPHRHPGSKAHRVGEKEARRGLDAAIAELAARQYGVVAGRQLRSLGLGPNGISRRALTGRLHRVHQGVYAVGHPVLAPKAHWLAAVLACGDRAVLSHRSAAALWQIRPSAAGLVDVSVPSRAGRSRAGIRVHRATGLTGEERVRCEAIPCTSVARTLLDLATVVDERSLERAINEAEVLRLFDLSAIHRTIERAGPRQGAGALRRAIAAFDPLAGRTRSELERLFLEVCRGAGLPPPEVNEWLELGGRRYEVDFLWRRQRVVVETDGYAVHSTRRAFEHDRHRGLLLARAGYLLLRLSWRQVLYEREEIIATLRGALARSAVRLR